MGCFPSGSAALPPPYEIGGGHEVQQESVVGLSTLDCDCDECRSLALVCNVQQVQFIRINFWTDRSSSSINMYMFYLQPSCFAPSCSFPSILETGTEAHSQEVGAGCLQQMCALGAEQCSGSSTQLLDHQAEDAAGLPCHEDDYNLSITLDELEKIFGEDGH